MPAVFVGVCSAVGGGILRDVLWGCRSRSCTSARSTPSRPAAGCLVLATLDAFGVTLVAASIVGVVVTAVIRVLAVVFDLSPAGAAHALPPQGRRRDRSDADRQTVTRALGEPHRQYPQTMAPIRSIRLRREAWGFAIGSIFFAVGAVPFYAEGVGGVLTNLTFFVGAIFFTLAAFIQLALSGRRPPRSGSIAPTGRTGGPRPSSSPAPSSSTSARSRL